MHSAVRFGVNYTPSQGWFHHWLDFDLDSVRADLDSIAALGLDHIRVFPLWPYFQPNRTLVRPRAVEQLVALADSSDARRRWFGIKGIIGQDPAHASELLGPEALRERDADFPGLVFEIIENDAGMKKRAGRGARWVDADPRWLDVMAKWALEGEVEELRAEVEESAESGGDAGELEERIEGLEEEVGSYSGLFEELCGEGSFIC